MGRAVVHFEVIGKDAEKLQGFYSQLFGWEMDANNPMKYGMVGREDNLDQGIGIGGGVGPAQEGSDGWVTFYVSVEDVEEGLKKAESLGGTRVMGPEEIMGSIVIGLFHDPEGNLVGVVQT
jgi:uncharacterized protein